MKLQLGDLLLRHWCVLAVGALAMDSRALSWISAFVTKKKSPVSLMCVWVRQYRDRGLGVFAFALAQELHQSIRGCVPVAWWCATTVAASCGGRNDNVVDDRDSA